MTTWLIHGFNVSDGGKGSIGRLAPYLPLSQLYSYGWTGPLSFGGGNAQAIRELRDCIAPGDAIVAHSNGALICWELARLTNLGAVVVINPALRRDTRWPDGLPVLCLANETDWIVSLARPWGRLRDDNDAVKGAGWGAAGRYGFDLEQDNVYTLFTNEPWWTFPVEGHSGVFEHPIYWGDLIAQWLAGENQPEQKGEGL